MPANRTLEYDVKVSGLLPAAGQPMPNGERPRWSPLSHTLIYGPAEAVLVDPPLLAQPVPDGGFTVDGHPLVPVEAGHSDTDDTTVLHAPSIGLVAAGDVVYNNVHQYLAETPNGGFDGWHRALDVVESLRPAAVVAGHKDAARPDAPANIAETRRYLDDGARLLAPGPTRLEFFAATLAAYPDRVNRFTVWLNATRLLSA